jgi:hypothetical protein
VRLIKANFSNKKVSEGLFVGITCKQQNVALDTGFRSIRKRPKMNRT